MRVVAGKYRAKKLKEFDIGTTRPTLDRIKEAMFSSIQFDVNGAIVVDLFSGTGALGLEAISRGASKVYFVDSNREAIKIIKENLAGVQEDYEICCSDYERFLTEHKNSKFDIFLLDPPFASNYDEIAIDKIIKSDLMNEGGTIVYEKAKSKQVEFDYENIAVKSKIYGTVEVIFLRKM